jgi:hypothetical protein
MLSSLGADTSEKDLWSFDDEDEMSESRSPQVPEEPTIAATPVPPLMEETDDSAVPRLAPEPVIPASRAGKLPPRPNQPHDDIPEESISPAGNDDMPADASEDLPTLPRPRRAQTRSAASGVSLGVSSHKPFDHTASVKIADLEDIGELDDWDEPEPSSKVGTVAVASELTVQELPDDQVDETERNEADLVGGGTPEPVDEFSAPPPATGDVKPLSSLRPKLGLSAAERIGLVVFSLMLIAACGLAFHYTLGGLPTTSARAPTVEFPVKGQRTTIEAAETYWREPVTDGPEADTVRRGTQLIPVIDLDVRSGSGALRIFFHDQSGNQIGDSVSRTVPNSGKLTIAASAGFTGNGDYAAYLTEESARWTVKVHEGPSASAPFGEFSLLFEIPVSSNRR